MSVEQWIVVSIILTILLICFWVAWLRAVWSHSVTTTLLERAKEQLEKEKTLYLDERHNHERAKLRAVDKTYEQYKCYDGALADTMIWLPKSTCSFTVGVNVAEGGLSTYHEYEWSHPEKGYRLLRIVQWATNPGALEPKEEKK
jgi:hypothetical protein